MANDGAPVCQLPNKGQVPPSQPGALFPPIPKAQDLPSAIAAINGLVQIVNILRGSPLPGNNLSLNIPNLPGFPLLKGTAANQGSNTVRFVEIGRTTELVKIENPDDDTQFIIVRRINLITFMDKLTGSTLLWNRGT